MLKRKQSEAAKGQGLDTIIGASTRIEGELVAEASIRIDGRYKGKLTTEGMLVVGEGAVVEADVIAEEVEIAGTLTGDVVVSQRLTITSTGKLFGNARAARLVIDEGAIFRGQCETNDRGSSSLQQDETTYRSAPDETE